MLESNNETLLTFQKSQFRIYDIKLKCSQIVRIDPPKTLKSSQTIQMDHQKTDDNLGYVLAGSVSHCNNYICVSDDYKGLYLYNKIESQWTLIRQCFIERRCSSIKFSKDNQHILIADKSGYVLRLALEFETDETHDKVEKLRSVILGHVSVLIDFDLHPSQKLIATADRDEKIRVSFYPNSFEIYTFLLGHSKFVSQVKFSDDGKKLYSAAADGFLVIWDLQNKTELHKHRYCDENAACIAIVTRMFIKKGKVFLFFKNEAFVQIVTVEESNEGLSTTFVNVPISVPVSDAALCVCDDSIMFVIMTVGTDNIRLNCFDYHKENDSLTESPNWLGKEDFSDSPVSQRNQFLDSLPKMPLDKTGLQIYFESKEKRLKLTGNKPAAHNNDNDEEEDD